MKWRTEKMCSDCPFVRTGPGAHLRRTLQPKRGLTSQLAQIMTDNASMKLKPGDIVRVVGERGTAKIRSILTSMHGVLLEKRIGRFRTWNIDEIRLVKRGQDTEMAAEHRAKLTANWRKIKRDLVKRG